MENSKKDYSVVWALAWIHTETKVYKNDRAHASGGRTEPEKHVIKPAYLKGKGQEGIFPPEGVPFNLKDKKRRDINFLSAL